MLSVVLARLVWRYLRRGSRAASPLIAQFRLSPAQKIAVGGICGTFNLAVYVTNQLFKGFAIRACGSC